MYILYGMGLAHLSKRLHEKKLHIYNSFECFKNSQNDVNMWEIPLAC